MKRFIRTYWMTMVVAGMILYLSLATGQGLAALPRLPRFENADKLMHFLMYLGLGGVMTWEMRQSGKTLLMTGLIAVGLSSAYGGALELIQPYFPPRTCDLLDFIADAMGAGAGYILVDVIWTNWSTK